MMKYFQERMWLVFAILAALCWGVWGILAKFISSDISPYANHLLFTIGMLFTIPFVIKKCKWSEANTKGIIWGIVAGILAIIGNVAVYKSFATGGLAAVVIPVTNLYPLVTIGVAMLVLKEKMHWLNGVGIVVVIPAIIMLSGQSEIFDNPSLFFTNLGLKLWLIFALVALVFWGLFSAAQKVTTNYISAEWSYLSFIGSSVLISIGFMVFGFIDFKFSTQTLWVGSLAGMLNGLGVLASFAAYSAQGKASKVTTVAGALQPVFTIFLAITFLGERLGWIEFVGIGLAIIGSLLLSVEKKTK
ncbi:MAG: DMT family transporter [Flavobacterium sp.]|nr:DMT family transporter [Flavobacterium sp.]